MFYIFRKELQDTVVGPYEERAAGMGKRGRFPVLERIPLNMEGRREALSFSAPLLLAAGFLDGHFLQHIGEEDPISLFRGVH